MKYKMHQKSLLYLILLLFSNLFSDPNANGGCKVASNPSSIVVAGGSIAEILYYINEGDRIIGVDVTSTYPDAVKVLPSIGYVRNLSIEGVLSLNPTLILGEDDMGPKIVVDQLKEIDVELQIIPEDQTIDGIIEKIKCIASIIGSNNQAENIINDDLMPKIVELRSVQDSVKIKRKRVMLILSMQGTSPVVAGLGTSGDNYIKLIGAKNVFDSFRGWKPVSEEAVIQSDPDYFIIPSRDMHKNFDFKSITTNAIFRNTKAGSKKKFIFDDAMVMLGFGPRTISSALRSAKQILK